MSKQSPIFEKTEAFIKWIFEHTVQYPKYERFRLAKRLDDTILDFHRSLVQAVYNEHPKQYLEQADLHLNLLRSYFRIALQLKHISSKQYLYASKQTEELGRLLGGWIKKA